MGTVGLIVHLGRESAATQAGELADLLLGSGHVVRMPEADANAAALSDSARRDVEIVESEDAFGTGLDLVVSLGGDGSILRTVSLVGSSEVPIMGVDHGQLGYLTEVSPSDAPDAVQRFFRGDYAIEARMLESVEVDRKDGSPVEQFLALNEVVVERSADVNTIRVAVSIDDEFFTTYAVDGMIIATPTGSTAYAFSARGPIIAPSHRALLLAPVSPHMLFDRSLVLEPNNLIECCIDGHRPATVSVDGVRVAIAGDGATVRCTAAATSAQLVTFGSRQFHHVLKAKFGLNDR